MTSLSYVNDTARAPKRSVLARLAAAEGSRAYLFLLPYLVIYFGLIGVPAAYGIWMSFYDIDLLGGGAFYIGLENYEFLFDDHIFLGAIRNTVLFVIISVPAFLILALALALALNDNTRLAAILRGVFFAMLVLSVTIVTLVWQMVYSPNRGLLSGTLQSVGMDPVAVLANSATVLPALAVATIWWSIGLPMILLLAALQQIPDELYEAAAMDNATRWQAFRSITFPSIRRTFIVVVIIELILQFQFFGQPYLMTQGGPDNTSRSLAQFIYETGFRNWTIGYASAAAQVLSALMLITALLQYWVSSRGQDG